MQNDEVCDRIYGCETVKKFLDPSRPEFNADDVDYCAKPLDAAFVMTVDKEERWPAIRKVML